LPLKTALQELAKASGEGQIKVDANGALIPPRRWEQWAGVGIWSHDVMRMWPVRPVIQVRQAPPPAPTVRGRLMLLPRSTQREGVTELGAPIADPIVGENDDALISETRDGWKERWSGEQRPLNAKTAIRWLLP
jgi:hypothetical protein